MAKLDMKTLRALAIDDNPFMLKLVTRLLYEMHFDFVFEAENGAEGLETIRKVKGDINLVICDLVMPVMNGFEFVRKLRAGPETDNPRVPVIILTGHSQREAVEHAVNLGIQGFLTKPVSREALEKKVVSALTSPPIDPSALNLKAPTLI